MNGLDRFEDPKREGPVEPTDSAPAQREVEALASPSILPENHSQGQDATEQKHETVLKLWKQIGGPTLASMKPGSGNRALRQKVLASWRQARRETVLAFWNKLYGEGTGYFAVAAEGPSRPFGYRCFRWPDEAERALARVEREAIQKHSVWQTANLFTERRRLNIYARPIRVLYTDDVADWPDRPPSLVVQTSPSKVQGYWFLSEPVAPDVGRDLQRRLVAHVGGDDGAKDLAHVLRVPGFINRKPKYNADPPMVRIIHESEIRYTRAVFDSVLPTLPSYVSPNGQTGTIAREPVERSTVALPSWMHDAVNAPDGTGLTKVPNAVLASWKVNERSHSKLMWEVQKALRDHGLTPGQVAAFVEGSTGLMRDEERKSPRTKIDLATHKLFNPDDSRSAGTAGPRIVKPLIVKTWAQIMAEEYAPPPMLVEGLVIEKGIGMCGGCSWSYKSTALLDQGISLAAGIPVFGHYAVPKPARVLYVHAEQDQFWTSRVQRVAQARGIADLRDIPFGLLNLEGRKLTNPDHFDELTRLAGEQGTGLTIIDSFSSAFGVPEEDKAGAMIRDFRYPVRRFVQESGSAIEVLHHAKKYQRHVEPFDVADLLRGSGDLDAAIDFGLGLWVASKDDEDLKIKALVKTRGRYTPTFSLGALQETFTRDSRINPDDLYFHPITYGGEWKARGAGQTLRVIREVYAKTRQPITQKDIQTIAGMPKATVIRHFATLAARGKLAKMPGKLGEYIPVADTPKGNGTGGASSDDD